MTSVKRQTKTHRPAQKQRTALYLSIAAFLLVAVSTTYLLARRTQTVSAGTVHAASTGPTTPQYNFPHLFSYTRWGNASGQPFLTGGNILTSPTDLTAVQQSARNEVITLPVEPTVANSLSKGLSSVINTYRTQNPGALILGYWWTDFPWSNADLNPAPHVVGDLVRELTAGGHPERANWLLYDNGGSPWGGQWGPDRLNLLDSSFVDWYAQYIAQHIHDTGLFDGIFFDNMCDSIAWEQNYNTLNYVRAGASDASDFSTKHAAGLRSLIAKIRATVGTDYLLVGNCGWGSNGDQLNGLMSEYFPQFSMPDGGFSKWAWNMMNPDGGYIAHDATVLAPGLNLLTHFVDDCTHLSAGTCDTWDPSLATNAANLKLVRYGLTSSLLGNGFYFLDEDRGSNSGWTAHTFWYDEFDNAGQGRGYLGQPTSIPYQYIDEAKLSAPNRVTNGGFESALGAEWYTSTVLSGNTIARDTTVAHTGSASLKARIQTATDSANWYTETAHQIYTLTLGADNIYSLTFWAKADRARSMRVRLDDAGTAKAYETLSLDSTWREYQVSMKIAAGSNKSIASNLYFGSDLGTVWIDDVMFNQGLGNIWARDFDHGTSFVNPCADIFYCTSGGQTLTFNLPATMKHINGTQDSAVNNGQTTSTVTIPPGDGVILLSTSNPPTTASQCTESWSCGSWSACNNNVQTRVCTDAHACRTSTSKPAETQSCTSPLPPTPGDTQPPTAVTDLKAE